MNPFMTKKQGIEDCTAKDHRMKTVISPKNKEKEYIFQWWCHFRSTNPQILIIPKCRIPIYLTATPLASSLQEDAKIQPVFLTSTTTRPIKVTKIHHSQIFTTQSVKIKISSIMTIRVSLVSTIWLSSITNCQMQCRRKIVGKAMEIVKLILILLIKVEEIRFLRNQEKAVVMGQPVAIQTPIKKAIKECSSILNIT